MWVKPQFRAQPITLLGNPRLWPMVQRLRPSSLTIGAKMTYSWAVRSKWPCSSVQQIRDMSLHDRDHISVHKQCKSNPGFLPSSDIIITLLINMRSIGGIILMGERIERETTRGGVIQHEGNILIPLKDVTPKVFSSSRQFTPILTIMFVLSCGTFVVVPTL